MNEQDEALAKRHAEREKISDIKFEIQNSKNAPTIPQQIAMADSPVGRQQYDSGKEIAITAWRFETVGWQFQITAKGDAMERSGRGYVVISLEGAATLWRELTQALRDRGVIA